MFFVVCSVRDSIKHEDKDKLVCDTAVPMDVFGDFVNDLEITYTYSVSFEVGVCVCVSVSVSVSGQTWINSLVTCKCCCFTGEQRHQMGIPVGLHPGVHAPHQHPVVQVR